MKGLTNMSGHRLLRKFNRAVYNRAARLIAGKWLYALVYHTGRRSGKAYTTPVVAEVKDGFVYIPLPYGDDTDWNLNIRRAGGCRVMVKRRLYQASQPEQIAQDVALPYFKESHQKAFKRFKINTFLRMKVG
jgi:deazaflavin-dependent oxidoreductase (nitroreductase family)